MFKVSFPEGHSESYSEEYQANPLRWMLLKKGAKKNEFVQNSMWLKCKDFFNDYVFARNKAGAPFSIYGFNTKDMDLGKPDEPVYVLIKQFTPEFLGNLGTINTWLADKQGFPPITATQEGEYILLEFPPVYWANTYNISLISLMLRVINTDKQFKSFEEVEKLKVEPGKWDVVVKKGKYFQIPDKLKDYVWYQDEKNNNKTMTDGYSISHLVHNNGVVSWSKHL